ncbi:MAG: hypothetical protein IKC61_04935 [Clostridia bacterium]|nr:hypothetical protein [Clostridia bacterium]
MNTNSKRLGIYLAAVILLTSAATSLRTVACMTALNYGSGYFTDKTLINTANIIIALTVLGSFSYLFVAPHINLRASFSTSATYVPAGVLGVATAFFGTKVLSYATGISVYPIFPDNMARMESIAKLVGILVALLAFLSIAHHFLSAFITESKTELRSYFAMATITFFALYSMLIYLDPTISIGDSSKILRLTAFITSAIFFLYEARISIGREMWRLYTVFGLVAAALCAYTSIPGIIVYYAKDSLISSADKYSLVSIEEYLLLLALFIFISARLWITVSIREKKENELIKAFATYADERSQKVDESFSRYQEIFASKQLSIFDLYGGEVEIDTAESEEDEVEVIVEEEQKAPTISDDAIYESIFGKMPEREPVIEVAENEIVPERSPEEVAEELLSTLDKAINDAECGNKETKI